MWCMVNIALQGSGYLAPCELLEGSIHTKVMQAFSRQPYRIISTYLGMYNLLYHHASSPAVSYFGSNCCYGVYYKVDYTCPGHPSMDVYKV